MIKRFPILYITFVFVLCCAGAMAREQINAPPADHYSVADSVTDSGAQLFFRIDSIVIAHRRETEQYQAALMHRIAQMDSAKQCQDCAWEKEQRQRTAILLSVLLFFIIVIAGLLVWIYILNRRQQHLFRMLVRHAKEWAQVETEINEQ